MAESSLPEQYRDDEAPRWFDMVVLLVLAAGMLLLGAVLIGSGGLALVLEILAGVALAAAVLGTLEREDLDRRLGVDK